MGVATRVLTSPPITEALVQVAVERSSALPIEPIRDLQEALGPEYSQAVPWHRATAQVDLRPGGQARVSEPANVAWQFSTADKSKAVRAASDGLSVHALRPYPGWDDLQDLAKSVWSKYLELGAPAQVKRIDVRYINRIELPLPMRDLSEYVTTRPMIDPSLPQVFSSLFEQIEVPFPADNCSVLLSQALVAADRPDRVPLIFDIDAYYAAPIPPTWADIQAVLNRLRDVKNRVFFGSLTERAMELFQ